MSEVATPIPVQSDEELAQQLQVQVVDVSHAVASNAIDHADNYINEQTTQHGFRGFLKRIWHGNYARDYIRQREIVRGRQEIVASGNIYALDEGSQADHAVAMGAVVNRFTQDFIHEGEQNSGLEEDEQGRTLLDGIRQLVSSYASGEMDDDELTEERTRLLSDYGDAKHQSNRNKGLLFADNIVEVARNARTAVSHGFGLERIDEVLSGRAGEARMGVRTEAHKVATDKLLDTLYSTKAGSLINEGSLATVTAVAMSVSKLTTQKVGVAAAATLGMGVGAGALAGAREHLRTGQDRTLHLRQRAEGSETTNLSGKKRERLEATRYDTVSAAETTVQLRETLAQLESSNPASIEAALAQVSDLSTRIKLSDELGVDLIQYSSKMAVEAERLEMDIELAQAKVTLRSVLEGLSDETLDQLGLTSRELEDALLGRQEQVENFIQEDISTHDAAFKRLRRNQTMKMAACGFVSSVVIGEAIQEVKAGMSHALRGVFEHPDSGQHRRTLLTGLLRHHNTTHEVQHPVADASILNDQTGVRLPPGYHLLDAGKGHWRLTDAHNKLITDKVSFDQQGHLTESSRLLLQHKGFKFNEAVDQYQTQHVVTDTVSRDPNAYMNAHPEQFTSVQRQAWYDNNTPRVFDKNELKLWWGGNQGVDQNGNYVFNVSQMAANGSFHGLDSANAQQLIHEGKMAIAMSFTKGTQKHVMMVAIDQHGNAVIDHNSFAGQSLFEMRGGQAHYLGAYAEAVQITGTNAQGETMIKMLATEVGENHAKSGVDQISRVLIDNHERIITALEAPKQHDLPIEIPFVMPFYGRRGLERLSTAERQRYGYGAYSPEQLRQFERELSPRLRRDPDAILNPGEELDWYRRELRRHEGRDYVNELERQIDASPELKEIGHDTKAIVCIPVAAVTEADNIYNTLSLYDQQEDESKQETKILLHVNWIDDAATDPAKQGMIDKTMAEIERARANFPELKIAVIRTVWERSVVEARRGVIGDVARRLYDSALLAADKAVREGRRNSDEDILIIRNDADAQGMSRTYLSNMIKDFEEHREADGFVGSIRWETSTHKDFPGFGVVTNFREIMHAITGRKSSSRRVPTIGINTAVRASTFAAVGCIGHGEYVGAGSDDLEIGNRIYTARDRGTRARSTESTSGYGASTGATGAQQDMTARTRRLRAISRRRESVRYRNPDGTSDNRAIRVVQAATVDTAGDRLLNIYREGELITQAWNDFDTGGHRARGEARGVRAPIGPEKLSDINAIAERIEQNISSMGTEWFKDPAYVRAGLAFMFPEKTKDGAPIYSLKWENGRCIFNLSSEGKTWLRNKLERDQSGHFDHFGTRVRRNLYHETPPGSRKKPNSARARFVQAVV